MMGENQPFQEVLVALSVGDTIPNVKLMTLTAEGPKPVQSGDVLGTGKIVLFAVPGAFTPTCSDHHLPGFVMQADEILARGVDRIACIAVNDPFVMGAWGNAQGTGDKVMMLSDGNGEFAAQTGMELDLTGIGLGMRMQRYAAILQDGVVQEMFLESNPGKVDVASADAVLKAL